jgi:hypothetical protein
MMGYVRSPMVCLRTTPASLLAGLTAMVLVSSGCVGLGLDSSSASSGVALIDLERPEMRGFAVASMTDMERDVRLETTDRRREKLTPVLFGTGIVLGTIGAIGGIAFGVAGYANKQQLNSAYEAGLTMDERDAFVSRGKAFNHLSIGMTTVAVLAYALAIVTYGVDWNRCGPLVAKNKRRRCDAMK